MTELIAENSQEPKKRPWIAPVLVVIEIDALTARSANPRDVPSTIGTASS